ncbi:hypothetical protein EIP91_006236 [Steccherinum ochraceum]|uniref:Uncharacterized protein n=1 Tax=Steccherinum ochraceum TaxID=92696 RepID=A0A4R0RED5_9APHY|nr:hypothetical protein EIP91_006236 [Steccherinum ochraceum]
MPPCPLTSTTWSSAPLLAGGKGTSEICQSLIQAKTALAAEIGVLAYKDAVSDTRIDRTSIPAAHHVRIIPAPRVKKCTLSLFLIYLSTAKPRDEMPSCAVDGDCWVMCSHNGEDMGIWCRVGGIWQDASPVFTEGGGPLPPHPWMGRRLLDFAPQHMCLGFYLSHAPASRSFKVYVQSQAVRKRHPWIKWPFTYKLGHAVCMMFEGHDLWFQTGPIQLPEGVAAKWFPDDPLPGGNEKNRGSQAHDREPGPSNRRSRSSSPRRTISASSSSSNSNNSVLQVDRKRMLISPKRAEPPRLSNLLNEPAVGIQSSQASGGPAALRSSRVKEEKPDIGSGSQSQPLKEEMDRDDEELTQLRRELEDDQKDLVKRQEQLIALKQGEIALKKERMESILKRKRSAKVALQSVVSAKASSSQRVVIDLTDD